MWGIHPETTLEDIANDLAASDIKIETKDIQKKSKEDAPLNSYKISVPAADLQKALNPEIWPLRVKVREYIYYAKKRQPNPSQQEQQQKEQQQQQQQQQQLPRQKDQQQPMQVGGVPTSNRYDLLASDPVLGQKL